MRAFIHMYQYIFYIKKNIYLYNLMLGMSYTNILL